MSTDIPRYEDSDDEPEEMPVLDACEHSWRILAAQDCTSSAYVMFGKPTPHTAVLGTCSDCGKPESWLLTGAWTMEQLTGSDDGTRPLEECTHCGEARDHPDHIVTSIARGGHIFATEGEQQR